MKRYFAALVFVFSSTALAGEESLNPFDLPYGKEMAPYTDYRDTEGLPMLLLGLDVPMPEDANLAMFNDYSLVYFADSGKVYSAQAFRVYETFPSCKKDWDRVVDSVLSKVKDVTIDSSGSYYVNDLLIINVGCSINENQPYFYKLSLHIFDKETNEKVRRGHQVGNSLAENFFLLLQSA